MTVTVSLNSSGPVLPSDLRGMFKLSFGGWPWPSWQNRAHRVLLRSVKGYGHRALPACSIELLDSNCYRTRNMVLADLRQLLLGNILGKPRYCRRDPFKRQHSNSFRVSIESHSSALGCTWLPYGGVFQKRQSYAPLLHCSNWKRHGISWERGALTLALHWKRCH